MCVNAMSFLTDSRSRYDRVYIWNRYTKYNAGDATVTSLYNKTAKFEYLTTTPII